MAYNETEFLSGLTMGLTGKGVPGFEDMMLYNGMRLPDINGVWTDKEAYPYAFVYHSSNVNSYFLCLNPQSAVIDGVSVHTRGYGVSYANWGGSTWTYLGTQWTEGEWTKIASITEGCQWSNHDILNEDGSVYLAASEPVVDTFTRGYLLGTELRNTRPAREPVVYYSYNGMVLPDINTVWTDKETYPYAVVDCLYGRYYLCLSSEAYMVNLPTSSSTTPWLGYTANCNHIKFDLTDGVWVPNGGEQENTQGVVNKKGLGEPAWANHDLYKYVNKKPTSAVFLAASEPVPVYE